MLIRKLTSFVENDKVIERWKINKIDNLQYFTFIIEKKYDGNYILFDERMFAINKYDVLFFVNIFIDKLKNDDAKHWKEYYSFYIKELSIFLLNFFTIKQLNTLMFKNNVYDVKVFNSFNASIKNNNTLIENIDDVSNMLLFYNSFLK